MYFYILSAILPYIFKDFVLIGCYEPALDDIPNLRV